MSEPERAAGIGTILRARVIMRMQENERGKAVEAVEAEMGVSRREAETIVDDLWSEDAAFTSPAEHDPSAIRRFSFTLMDFFWRLFHPGQAHRHD